MTDPLLNPDFWRLQLEGYRADADGLARFAEHDRSRLKIGPEMLELLQEFLGLLSVVVANGRVQFRDGDLKVERGAGRFLARSPQSA